MILQWWQSLFFFSPGNTFSCWMCTSLFSAPIINMAKTQHTSSSAEVKMATRTLKTRVVTCLKENRQTQELTVTLKNIKIDHSTTDSGIFHSRATKSVQHTRCNGGTEFLFLFVFLLFVCGYVEIATFPINHTSWFSFNNNKIKSFPEKG